MSFFNFGPSLAALFSRARSTQQIQTVPTATVSLLTLDEVKKSNAVTSSVNSVARVIAQVDFYCEQKDIQDLLLSPNEQQTAYSFVHGIVVDLLIHGNAYLRVFRGAGTGKIMSILPLDPQQITVSMTPDGRSQFLSRDTGETLSADDVFHLKDGGTHDLVSPSRLEGMEKIVTAFEYSNDLILDSFRTGIGVSGILKSTNPKTERMSEEHLQQLTQLLGHDGRRRGGLAYLGFDHELDVIDLKVPYDQQFKMLRDDCLSEISSAFGISGQQIGGESDSSYSSAAARQIAVSRDTYFPILVGLTQTLSKALKTPITFNDLNLIKGDLLTVSRISHQSVGGPSLTVNESRKLLWDLPPLDEPEADLLSPPTPVDSHLPAEIGDRVDESEVSDTGVPDDANLRMFLESQ